jgi:hypothetical protein
MVSSVSFLFLLLSSPFELGLGVKSVSFLVRGDYVALSVASGTVIPGMLAFCVISTGFGSGFGPFLPPFSLHIAVVVLEKSTTLKC